jgi:alpha-L-rhamnosidase
MPVDLRCEYLTDPLGIDVIAPRLTWRLHDDACTRGQRQTACRVLVASSKALLDEERPDLWDSGKLVTEHSAVEFGGTLLASGQDCHWKVMVFDRDGAPSPWSRAARFSMGLLQPDDWTGTWIRHPDASSENHIWFRDRLHLDAAPRSAFIHVASLGYHELHVNGRKADDRVLAPAQTRLDKRVLYVTYDITPFLRAGDNVIAIWHGSGWARFDFFRTQPALRVQVDIHTADGRRLASASGAHWRCAVSSSQNFGGTQWGDNGGEKIDARNHVADWDAVGFDDSRWPCAREAFVTPTLSAHMVEPTRIIETFTAREVAGLSPCKVDLGKNFTGWLEIKMRGLTAGDEVVIKISDEPGTEMAFCQQSRYVAGGADEETFVNRFNFCAGRYITIEGLKTPLGPADITAHALATDIARTGRFSCSHELFNRIYETDIWTFRACTTEGYTSDCPHRERLGYGEVAFATAWGIGLPGFGTGAFYTKHVRDWTDVQESNGWIHHTVPQINFHWGGPLWSSAGLNVAMEFYRHHGDRRVLEKAWATTDRWLAFLARHTWDGLLRPYDAHWGRFLGDWAAPQERNERGDSPESLLFNNCVYAMNLASFIEMSEILGKTEDVALYRARLAALKTRIHEHFFNPEQNTYATGRQVHQAFPLMTGVVPEKLRPAVAACFDREITETRPWFDMGSSGLPIILRYLIEHARHDELAACILSKDTEPSYGYFLSRGETAWPEYWKVDLPSRIHTCYTGISAWFIKSLCGIRLDPERPGERALLIQPAPVGGLTHAEGVADSPAGPVKVRWERTENAVFKLTVMLPPNSTAIVRMPSCDPEAVTENGHPVRHAAGVTFVRAEANCAVLAIGSGHYEFAGRLA